MLTLMIASRGCSQWQWHLRYLSDRCSVIRFNLPTQDGGDNAEISSLDNNVSTFGSLLANVWKGY
jgi:hypothetical protein